MMPPPSTTRAGSKAWIKDMIPQATSRIHASTSFFIVGSFKCAKISRTVVSAGESAVKRATSAEVLESLSGDYPICALILDYRRYQKLDSTYVGALIKLRDENDWTR